ncbi:MAG TPA: hypothetical protein VLE53_00420 [Gemmatimonadaceae bacterium]|nr:hypothetical protein [Gemmatimonadaceae bacterium]
MSWERERIDAEGKRVLRRLRQVIEPSAIEVDCHRAIAETYGHPAEGIIRGQTVRAAFPPLAHHAKRRDSLQHVGNAHWIAPLDFFNGDEVTSVYATCEVAPV